jgi:stress-induced-phosphoprotein 1
MSVSAEEYKAKGNAALQANKLSEAIEHYTAAINADGTNHVYFSNRSAAYLKKGDHVHALEDAEACLGLNPEFAKGYSRKGAALHAAKRYNDSIAAYKQGLEKFPNDAGIKSGLASVEQEKERASMPGGQPSGSNPMAQLFGPQLMAQIAMDPSCRSYLNEPDFVEKIKLLQTNPDSINTMLSDPRILKVFQMVLGNMGMAFKEENGDDTSSASEKPPASSATASSGTAPKRVEKEEPMEVEEDLSDLSPEEQEARKKKKEAVKAKEKGNKLYGAKKFDDALAAYDEAISLDPTNMTFLSNKAAVFFAQKEWDKCIEACENAVEVGKENKAPFEDRAKALTRCGKAWEKKGDLGMAIEKLQAAQLEFHDKATQRLLKTMELNKKKRDALAYQDDEKAEEHKQKGNEHFRAKEFAEAVKEYEEAVKRAPKNATLRNNLSAALCKIMDFNGAKREIETALDLDPQYVKAWARKGDIEIVMKENHKAMDSYKKGLALDPTNSACKEGLRKVSIMINAGSANISEEEKRERAEHAMADPEIQNILRDPIIQQVLQDFQTNQKAANEAMRDPTVRSKIEKLIASGIVQAG